MKSAVQVSENRMETEAKVARGGMLRPTTKDLARAAGVSRATVDRVLNGRDGVKQKTVDRVNGAIERLGFVLNLSAANLARSTSYRILFALPRSGDQFLAEIVRHIAEAETVLAADHVWCDLHQIEANDPHSISAFLASLTPEEVSGVAIMAPETPQVRDAIARLQERGVAALPFISNQTRMDDTWVGINNRAAGATAATLMGRFAGARAGGVMVVSESMQSRDSLERRLGFDAVLNARFPHLRALPSLETYGDPVRAAEIIGTTLRSNPGLAGIYVLASEARIPLSVLDAMPVPGGIVRIAHERTPFTEAALRSGSLDCVIAQDAGHLVRSALRRLKAMVDRRDILRSQEKIRVEILLDTNI